MGKTWKIKSPLPLWRRILLGLVLTAIVLLTILMLASYLAGKQLAAEIIKVSKASEPLSFTDLEADLSRSSTDEDAARYYLEALMSTRADDLENLIRMNSFYRKNVISLPASQFPSELHEKITQNLANFQPVFEKFDRGADIPLSHFNINIQQGIQKCKIRLLRVQAAAVLLSLRTLDFILRDEDEDAANSVISMLKMIRVLDSNPTMFVYAVKTRLVALACKDITLLLVRGRLSGKSLAKLQKVLSETIPENTLERMFLAERVYQMEIGRNLMPQKIALQLLSDKVPELPERIPAPRSIWTRLRIRQKSTQYFRDMAQLIAAARRPWPEPLDMMVGNEPRPLEKPGNLLESGADFIRLTAQTFVFVRCTILAIAFERYQLSHGEMPPSLDDVSPIYINSIPLDPFTGKKLLFRHDGETYLMYSVGINRQDDGGSIIPKAGDESPLDRGLSIRFRKLK